MCQKLGLIVFGLVSLASAAPGLGYLGGYPHGLPPATSYSSRIDFHGPEYVKTYAAPVLTKTIVPAHIVKPVISGISYHHKPLVGYGGYSHGLGNGLEYGYGLGQGLEHGLGYGYGIGQGLEHGHAGLGYSKGLGLGYGQRLKHYY